MKTTKIILLIIVIFTPSIYNVNITFGENNIKTQTEIEEVPKVEKSKVKINKRKTRKTIKKEIQKRKKYHKTLIEAYNKYFNEKSVEMIKNNSLIIDRLK